MDPEAVWTRLLDALEAGDEKEARRAALDLLSWINRGGFPPDVIPGRLLPWDWSRAVVHAACLATWKKMDFTDW
ncbi:MAG: hypothetical protein K1X67_05650 [Fimbriimonadaceae bacterium]|nr:hypothetical protein [Fimbriimonadaceae bacterium]